MKEFESNYGCSAMSTGSGRHGACNSMMKRCSKWKALQLRFCALEGCSSKSRPKYLQQESSKIYVQDSISNSAVSLLPPLYRGLNPESGSSALCQPPGGNRSCGRGTQYKSQSIRHSRMGLSIVFILISRPYSKCS